MGLRFTEETTTAVYEFEKMTWDEMDEVFYTEDEIGDFRHSAFMIECGLEEEDWDVPDVEPLPWPKEIDENKIKKFESNFALQKEKRKQKIADFEANGYPKETSSRTAMTEESSTSTHNTQMSPRKPTIPSTTPPTSPKTSGAKLSPTRSPRRSPKKSTTPSTSPKTTRSPISPIRSPRKSPTKPTISSITPPTSPKVNRSVTINAKSPRRSPTRSPMKSPVKRSYSMGTRAKDKAVLDNVLKKIESPLVSPKKKVPTPAAVTKPKPKEQEDKEVRPITKAENDAKSTLSGVYYKAPLAGGGTKITSTPYKSLAQSPRKGNKKNRNTIFASLDASLDDDLSEEIPPMVTSLKPTKSADLEHMRAALNQDEDKKDKRKLRRNLMRTNSGSLRNLNLQRKPRKGKKPEEESPTKPARRTKKGSLNDSMSKIDEEDGPKKKKRSSLTKQPSEGGLDNGKEASDHKPKKRSSLKRTESLRLKRADSTISESSGDSKRRSSLRRQGSLKRSESFKSGDSTKKKRPTINRSNSMSAASVGSSKRRSSLKHQSSLKAASQRNDADADRKTRRGMRRAESLRSRGMENSISELSVDMSKDEEDTKPRSRSSPRKKSKDKRGKELAREDSDSSMSEEDLKSSNLLSPVREPAHKRGKSIDRSIRSVGMSSVSSGVSFLGSIDDVSVGSDQSIETVDDDELFNVPERSADTDDESDTEMQEEFYRYMKARPKSHLAGVKVYTIYQEKKHPMNGKMVASREYVCASLAMTGDR